MRYQSQIYVKNAYLCQIIIVNEMNLQDFNPNGVGVDNGNYFGMPFTPEDAQLVLISAPWDVTSSYGAGSSYAPDAIIEASTQLDFYDPVSPDEWRKGIATAEIDYDIQELSERLRSDAEKVIEHLEEGGDPEAESIARKVRRINEGSFRINDNIYTQAQRWMSQGKIVGLVGGDHSTSFGAIKAVGEACGSMGVLHFDAHCDLRECYEGFEHSHASIMFNVLKDVPEVSKIVEVGVRDFCDDELALVCSTDRVEMFDDYSLSMAKFGGRSWLSLCEEIVERLPEQVYISMDIDALSIEYCPNTGTPVVGGLSFNEAVCLMDCVARSGRRIVGFDMVEVVPTLDNKIDASVGARMLYKMCGIALKTRK